MGCACMFACLQVFTELESAHSTVQRRLAAARVSDEAFGSILLAQNAGTNSTGGTEGSPAVSRPNSGPRAGLPRSNGKERHLPPNGFL